MFVVITPFTNSNYFLFMHAFVVPFIMFHWVINNNTCCLTVLEQSIKEKITGKPVDKNDCVAYKIVAPIYDFNKNYKQFENFIYIFTAGLWSISAYKLYSKYENGEIKSYQQLFQI